MLATLRLRLPAVPFAANCTSSASFPALSWKSISFSGPKPVVAEKPFAAVLTHHQCLPLVCSLGKYCLLASMLEVHFAWILHIWIIRVQLLSLEEKSASNKLLIMC